MTRTDWLDDEAHGTGRTTSTQQRPPEWVPSPSTETQKARILVVDDDAIVLELLENVLRLDSQLDVTALSDSGQALEMLQEREFDVLITDLKMPGVDGLALAETVRQKGGHTQVILISGYASPEIHRHARQCGAFAFIAKPFRMATLTQTVHKALAQTRVA